MKIAIGCDHGGLEHKNAIAEHLRERGFEVEDFGIYEQKPIDYPVIALKVAKSVAEEENELGSLVCGTGIGMSLAANKVKGIRAAAVSEHFPLNTQDFIIIQTFCVWVAGLSVWVQHWNLPTYLSIRNLRAVAIKNALI